VDIVGMRLVKQRLLRPARATVHEVVYCLGAVQAQDYGGAAWAVGQRAQSLTRTDVDAALADGTVLRTHVLRPTWHLVAREDIRWMLELTAPRVRRQMAFGDRRDGLDEETFTRSNRVLAAALHGGRQMTRAELRDVFADAGVNVANPSALNRLTMRAELDAVVCSGAVRGRQHTYALLDDRAPPAPPILREEALARLAARYFGGHGPAIVKDFAWWSGLPVGEATLGVRNAQPALQQETHGSSTYWFAASAAPRRATGPQAHLLPNYDEYTVGYADRSPVIALEDLPRLRARDDSIFTNVVLLDGLIVGTWGRTLGTRDVRITVNRLRPQEADEVAAIETAATRYGAFLALRPTVHFRDAPPNATRFTTR
jgi:hypothetical protein